MIDLNRIAVADLPRLYITQRGCVPRRHHADEDCSSAAAVCAGIAIPGTVQATWTVAALAPVEPGSGVNERVEVRDVSVARRFALT